MLGPFDTAHPLDPSRLKYIVLHSTDSPFGDAQIIDTWHKQRGWSGIGYHYVVLNCFPSAYRWEFKRPKLASDGQVEPGRSEGLVGAHVQGKNSVSLGVAMVGKDGAFSSKQIESALAVCTGLIKRFPSIETVLGHFELDKNKTDPDLDMDLFRGWLI